MQPPVARVVHYVEHGTHPALDPPVCRAATITEVGGLVDGSRYPGVEVSSDDEVVSLVVHRPDGAAYLHGVLHGAEIEPANRREQFPDPDAPQLTHVPGTWHWPERVD